MGKPKAEINIGDRFGKLIILKEIEPIRYECGSSDRQFLCKCDCGNETIARRSALTRNRLSSCGCAIGKGHTTHNLVYSRIYSVWKGMKARCQNKNHTEYHNYGGRGIIVCDDWQDFIKFNEWANNTGYNDDLEIDRINVDGNYCPENCRWITHHEQCFNKRNSRFITIDGITKHTKEWSEETGVSPTTLWDRYKKYGSSKIIFTKGKITKHDIEKYSREISETQI